MSSRQVGRLIWVDLTAGVPLIFGLINLGVTVAITGLAGGDSMSGGMGDPLNLLLTASMYTTAISLGGAAAHSGSIVNKGLVELANGTIRGRWAPIRIGMAASLSWAVIVQVVGLAIVGVRASPGNSSPWVVTLGLLSLLLTTSAAAAGSVVGVRFTAAPAAAALALATLAWFYGFTYATGPLRKLSPVYPEVYYSEPVIEPNHPLVLGQILCAVGIGVAALAVVAGRRFARTVLVVSALAALGAGAALVMSASGDPAQYSTHVDPVCRTQSSTTLCVFPQYADRIPADLAALSTVREAVRPYLATPEAYRQLGLPAAVSGVPYAGVYDDDEATRLAAAADATLPTQQCADAAAASSAAVDLHRWALALSGAPDVYAEGPDYTTFTPQQNRSWLAARLATLSKPC